jgi:hypothetical protein
MSDVALVEDGGILADESRVLGTGVNRNEFENASTGLDDDAFGSLAINVIVELTELRRRSNDGVVANDHTGFDKNIRTDPNAGT